MSEKKGRVILIGAGPGDIGLITVKGLEYLKQADVVVYDRLVSSDILSLSPKMAEFINVGKVMNHHNIPQPEINKILLNKALEGKNVVRLKGGDPFVFGRGGEELELLIEHNIEYEVVPGITSAVSALAYAGIPVSHRDFASSIHFVTGHAKDGLVENIDFKALVASKGTILFYMGVSTLNQLINGLIDAGIDKSTPCAAVENGTRSNMRTLISTVENMVSDAEKFQLRSPAVIAVGRVCSLGDKFEWFTKSKIFSKNIIVTRPVVSNNILTNRLKNLGAEVIDYPCIKINEIENNESLDNLTKNLDKYNMLVFASKNSAAYFFKALNKSGKDSRALSHLVIGALGKSTYDELKKYGIYADVIPDEYTFTAFAKSLKKAEINGRIAVLEAVQDKRLSDELKNQGFNVTSYNAYDIEYLPLDYIKPLQEYIDNGVISAFTSSAAVHGFVRGNKIEDLSKIKAVCIGKLTYETALNYKMKAYMAEKPTIDDLIEKLKEME